MGRRYTASFNRVSVSVVQDLFEILAAADIPFALEQLDITQDSDAGDAQSEQLTVTVRRVTGAPTSGSGGSTPTPRPLDQGDAAFGGTTEANNTTQLSGGTNVVLHTEAFNVMAGLHLVFPPDRMPVFRGQTRMLIALEAAPADALTMSGTATLQEIG